MCVVGFATKTQTVPHTHLELIAKSFKKKEKKGTQRMWRPLCFHFNFEMKKKNLKSKMVCVCGGNATTHNKIRPLHTHHKLFSKKNYKKEIWKKNMKKKEKKKKEMKFIKSSVCFCKKHCVTHTNKYSLSSKGRAHAMRGDAGSNPAASCLCACLCVNLPHKNTVKQIQQGFWTRNLLHKRAYRANSFDNIWHSLRKQ